MVVTKRFPKIIVIGGELSALATAQRVAENGVPVRLFSASAHGQIHPVYASEGVGVPSVIKGVADAAQTHFNNTIEAGDFLANQDLVRRMCAASPSIISLLDRTGVPFDRTAEGFHDFYSRQMGWDHLALHAGPATGRHILNALESQLQRHVSKGLVERVEGWDFLAAVLDNKGVCRGIVAQNTRSMELAVFKADAVIICTGGAGAVFGRFAATPGATGYAAAQLFSQGAYFANGEFVQVHLTAIPCADKSRLISDVVRAAGARLWVHRNGKPWYFLEDLVSGQNGPVSDDDVIRMIHKVVYEMNLGVENRPAVHLDVTHLSQQELENSTLAGVLQFYKKFTGTDPRQFPMTIFPAVDYFLGGLWIDDHHMTNIPGVFAAGECDGQYHGAKRLPGNAVLSAIFAGLTAAEGALRYASGLEKSCEETDEAHFIRESQKQSEEHNLLLDMSGPENVHGLREELNETMAYAMIGPRYNARLKAVLNKIKELRQRWHRIGIADKGSWMNREITAVRHFQRTLETAEIMVLGALLRNETRGVHRKPEFPERDDESFFKTTKARWEKDGPVISYEDVESQYLNVSRGNTLLRKIK